MKKLGKDMNKNSYNYDQLLQKYEKYVIASHTDLSGKIVYASERFCEISGYSKEELLGKSHNIVRHPDMPATIFKELWNTIKQDKTFVAEIKNLKKDGGYYWVKAVFEPIYDENNNKIGYSSIREDITDRIKLEKLNKTLDQKIKNRTKHIENLLYYDKLTGLKTKYALLEDIEKNIDDFEVLFLINIDNFQNINTLYGYREGDNILKQFAKCLKEFNKNLDYKIYRLHGDEFVLYKGEDYQCIDTYYQDLQHLNRIINNYNFKVNSNDEYDIRLDTTVGISMGQEDLISTVDTALRYAKVHKLPFKTYENSIDVISEVKDKFYWRDKIKLSLDQDTIIPVFQPIVNRDQEVIKYEILIRLKYENHVVAPNQFLEAAINTKQYQEMFKRLFIKAYSIIEYSNKIFSINISYDDITNHNIMSFIKKTLELSPNISKRIVFEILESSEVKDWFLFKDIIDDFRDLGVRIAIDDFGAGYSNLSNILHIKPEYLKIDGEFIKDITVSKESLSMVKAVYSFCKELNVKVIAEYVHSKEVFDILYDIGIEEFQGYYFSEPLEEV